MTDEKRSPEAAGELRRRAERKVRGHAAAASLEALSTEEQRRLVHELQVYQLELEMQNEELRRAQQEIEASRERYFELFDLAPVGYVTLSEPGLVLEGNLAVAGMLGVERCALVGQPLTARVSGEDQDVYYLLRRRLTETGLPQSCEIRMLRGDGSRIWARVEAVAARDVDGTPVCRVVLSDITERKQAEEALRDSEERYRMLVENQAEGMTVVDPDERFLFANPAADRLFGVAPGGLVGRNLAEFLSADQLALVLQQTEARRAGEKGSYDLRITRPDGSSRDLLVTAVPRVDRRGDFAGSLAVFHDMTERKRVTDELQRLNLELQQSVQKLQRSERDSRLISRLSYLLQSCQTAAEASRAIELAMPEILPDQTGWLAIVDSGGKAFEIAASWGGPHRDEEVFATDRCWALRRGHPHEVADPGSSLLCWHLGQPVGSGYLCLPLQGQGAALGLLHLKVASSGDSGFDYTRQLAAAVGETLLLSLSNLRLREGLFEEIVRDQLTGLHNRRFLDEVLPGELQRCLRRKAPLALALLELDDLERFNRTYGNHAGDQLLRQIATLLRAALRTADVVCRFGDKEFVLVLPDSPVEPVLPRLEELRRRAGVLRVEVDGKSIQGVTLSIGVAQAPEHGSTQEAILRAADQALGTARDGGGDRTVAFGTA